MSSRLLALAALLSGCAGSAASTTAVTAAEVPSPSATTAREAPNVEAPAGALACRVQTRDEGTTELYLEWQGSVAKGVLRRIAPSGEVTTQRVRAERYQNMIIADDVGATDLAVHAATVAEVKGKTRMRVAEGWATCQ